MSTFCRQILPKDPNLEALRSKAFLESANESQEWIKNLIKKTSKLHAGFLFQDLKTLQDICLYISETQNKITDPGWQAFGYHLGMNISLLKVIKNNNFTQEDPCYNVLLAYVQTEKASIGKIIEALYKMSRIDVLSRIRQSINELADIILSPNASLGDTSDYESQPTSEGSQSSESSDSSSGNEVFFRPKIIPPAPFIFQNIKINTRCQIMASDSFSHSSDKNNINGKECNERHKITEEKIKNENEGSLGKTFKNTSVIVNNNNNNNMHNNNNNNSNTNNSCNITQEMYKSLKKKKYGLKILLTFAEDGEKIAEKIAKELRKEMSNCPPIGIVILKEHAERVNMDPQLFIEGAFHQVDYVCPIITYGYYRLITKQDKPNPTSHQSHMDAYYVPYIYRLMNSYFIANDCLNDKIRCIVSEDSFQSIPFSFLTVNPVFCAWVNLSEVNELAKRLLKSRCLIN